MLLKNEWPNLKHPTKIQSTGTMLNRGSLLSTKYGCSMKQSWHCNKEKRLRWDLSVTKRSGNSESRVGTACLLVRSVLRAPSAQGCWFGGCLRNSFPLLSKRHGIMSFFHSLVIARGLHRKHVQLSRRSWLAVKGALCLKLTFTRFGSRAFLMLFRLC